MTQGSNCQMEEVGGTLSNDRTPTIYFLYSIATRNKFLLQNVFSHIDRLSVEKINPLFVFHAHS